MFTKRQMVGVLVTIVLYQGAVGLVKLAAARHATHDGADGVIGRAAQIIF